MKRLIINLILLIPLLLAAVEVNTYENSSYYKELISRVPKSGEFFNAVDRYRVKPENGLLNEMSTLRTNPLYLVDMTRLITQRLNETDDAKILFLLDTIMQDTDRFPRKYYHLQDMYRSKVAKPRDIFDYVSYLYETVQLLFSSAFAKLSDEEMELLRRFSEQEIYPPKGESIPMAEVTPLIEKIDFENLYKAGFILHTGITVISKEAGKLTYDNLKPLTSNSVYGKLIIGTPGSDTYSEEYAFLLDPAGNDVYSMPDIAQNNFFAMVDLAGNDLYQNPQSLLTADFGISCSYDLGGSDTYRAKRMFSAMYGYQFHYDLQGNDIYQAKVRSCGFASYGISLLQDAAGNDLYLADRYSLGVGTTGGFGVLFDVSGDDLYRSTTKPGIVSASQGFGYGRENCDGGIGVLYDKAGNDFYTITGLGQAAAVNNGSGLLIDELGNDIYSGDSKVQGYADNGSFASLYDKAGNDKYTVSSSTISSSSQRWSFVLKRDISGDDSYCFPKNTMFSFKEAGFFQFDFSGNDLYDLGKIDKGSYSTGSGMFLDTGGTDLYTSQFCQNDTLLTKGYYCVVKDTLSELSSSEVVRQAGEKAVPDTTSVRTIEVMMSRKKSEALSRLAALPDTTSGKWDLVRQLSFDQDESIRYALPELFTKANLNKETAVILDNLCNDGSFRVAAKAQEIRDLIKKKNK
jgi:hypothetical protein